MIKVKSEHELEQIALELHDIVKQKGVSIKEVKMIYMLAQKLAVNTPKIMLLFKQWEDTIIE